MFYQEDRCTNVGGGQENMLAPAYNPRTHFNLQLILGSALYQWYKTVLHKGYCETYFVRHPLSI